MRYFSALCARMYRFKANSRATISSTAIFLSQQSRQYFSSPRGSETSLAPHNVHRALATVFLGIHQFTIYNSHCPRRWRYRFDGRVGITDRDHRDHRGERLVDSMNRVPLGMLGG